MTEYTIEPTTQAHTDYITPRLRKADVEEMWSAYHIEPSLGVMLSVAVSHDTSYTGLADGEPVCIFGVALPSLLINAGRPWMLGTDKVPKHSRAFLRMSRAHVKEMSKKFPYMFNHVDARHDVAIKWLMWLGFIMEEAKPYGYEQLPFHRFYMRENNV